MQLLFLPDLAGDHRLFLSLRKRFPNLIAPDWSDTPYDATSLASISDFAAQCWQKWFEGPKPLLDKSQPFLIGGASFGGLVAFEIAWHANQLSHPPHAVLLVASCRQWNDVPDWYRSWSARSQWLPRWLSDRQFMQRHVHSPQRSESLTEEHVRLLQSVHRSMDPKLRQKLASWMANWRRDEADLLTVPFPIHQLHGRTDSVLPTPSAKHATLVLDAGHWLTLTHPQVVDTWVAAIVDDLRLKIHRGPKQSHDGE